MGRKFATLAIDSRVSMKMDYQKIIYHSIKINKMKLVYIMLIIYIDNIIDSF